MPKPLENRPGSGVLFHQDAQGNRPTLKGGVNVDGIEFELVGWEKVSKAGRAFISLSIKRVGDNSWRNRGNPTPTPNAETRGSYRDTDDDEIPF